MNKDDADAILRKYKKLEDEVNLCIIHNFLFEWPVIRLRSILEENNVDILGVDIRMLHTSNDEMISDRGHWVHDLPGGRFGECLIHPICVLTNLIGDLNIRDVYASKRVNMTGLSMMNSSPHLIVAIGLVTSMSHSTVQGGHFPCP